MRLLLAVTLCGLVACGGTDVDPQSRVAEPSTAPGAPATADDAREGCAAFTDIVDKAENNEVYDPATEVLKVYVGQQRYVLSPAVQECRDNPLAMNRLRLAATVQEENAG